MSYRDLLKHPLWQRKRLERLQACDWQCTKCNDANSPLHVHHRRYIVGCKPWEYADADLVVLCELCHSAEHGKNIRRIRQVMRTPVDRVAWVLMLRSRWWVELDASQRAFLFSLTSWHSELFCLIDGSPAQPWAVLREQVIKQTWGMEAVPIIEGENPAIKPTVLDLSDSLRQARQSIFAKQNVTV